MQGPEIKTIKFLQGRLSLSSVGGQSDSLCSLETDELYP